MSTQILDRGRRLMPLPPSPPPTRFAFRFTAHAISVAIPENVAGSYLLLDPGGAPLYVGRSDSCLRRRLLRHPLRGHATHFAATVTDTAREAYLIECYWWHRYRRDGHPLINLIHPAGYAADAACPFCRYTHRAVRNAAKEI